MTGEEAAPILVVEDEPNIAGLLRGYLEAAGYAVAQAANGHDALALARRHQPRLILLDLMLPGLDGMRVKRALGALDDARKKQAAEEKKAGDAEKAAVGKEQSAARSPCAIYPPGHWRSCGRARLVIAVSGRHRGRATGRPVV